MGTFKDKMCQAFSENNKIAPEYFDKFNVKRGLRNPDGTGVMAGVTNICNVHGYVVNDGEKQSDRGKLIFRGYNVEDLINRTYIEDRFGFEEIVYLLLTGELPDAAALSDFCNLLSENRELPKDFFEDMILKAPSSDVMNKLARSTLALYSYDSDAEVHTPEHEIDTAVSLIARMPVIMVVLWGGFVVQAAWVIQQHFKNGTFGDYLHKGPILRNCIFASLVGVLWVIQFVCQKAGEPLMGDLKYISFAIVMASTILFSTIIGAATGEWKGTGFKTKLFLAAGTLILLAGFCVISLGSK